jgi:glucan phosphoethanolaminetransferase (alkaline phosphatase superfamily)
MELNHILLGVCLGISLSACCGFRVFIPLLVSNVAALTGFHHFASGFEWMGSWLAFSILLTATLLEIGAYYIPWIDNLLDHITLPVAVLAGTLLATATFPAEIAPVTKWVLGIMAGGGSAGLIQTGTSLLRITSSATTAGTGNAVVATTENISAIALSVLALLIPVLVALLMLLLFWLIARKILKKEKK